MKNRFSDLVDVVGGKMTIHQVMNEVQFQMLCRPFLKRLIIDIQRKKGGYYTTFYMSEEDFETSRRVK